MHTPLPACVLQFVFVFVKHFDGIGQLTRRDHYQEAAAQQFYGVNQLTDTFPEASAMSEIMPSSFSTECACTFRGSWKIVYGTTDYTPE